MMDLVARHGARIAAVGLLAAALIGLWQALKLDSWGFDGPGAGFFPQLVAGVSVALALLVVLVPGKAAATEEGDTRAVELQPDYLSAWVTLGSYSLRQGRAAEAVDRLGKALAINPALIGIRNQLGEARIAAGDAAGGKRELLRSLRDNPNQPQVRARLQELSP